jgi:hypothetical protein
MSPRVSPVRDSRRKPRGKRQDLGMVAGLDSADFNGLAFGHAVRLTRAACVKNWLGVKSRMSISLASALCSVKTCTLQLGGGTIAARPMRC